MDILILERARVALQEQHNWHLSRTEPEDVNGAQLIPANDYGDSGMCERTRTSLAEIEAEINRCARIKKRIEDIMGT